MVELPFTREDIERAALRLRGNLVRTPVIGALRLPGLGARPGLRVKADLLQPSGSTWYRGAAHAGLRALGSWKGLVVQGADPFARAWYEVATALRLPVLAVVTGEQREALAPRHGEAELTWLEVASPSVEVAREAARARGYRAAPGLADRDFALGLATLALELDAELPAEVERVVVGVPALLAPLGAALGALGSRLRPASVTEGAEASLHAAREGLRLDLGSTSLQALGTALCLPPGAPVCALLAE